MLFLRFGFPSVLLGVSILQGLERILFLVGHSLPIPDKRHKGDFLKDFQEGAVVDYV